jgi:hypothetical protein
VIERKINDEWLEPRPIRDNDNVKDVLVLEKPTLCDNSLAIVFANQICTLNDIRKWDAEEEDRMGEVGLFLNYYGHCYRLIHWQKPDIRDWVNKSTDSLSTHDLIIVHLDKKYGVSVYDYGLRRWILVVIKQPTRLLPDLAMMLNVRLKNDPLSCPFKQRRPEHHARV